MSVDETKVAYMLTIATADQLTLRLAHRLLVSLHHAADTTKAADLRAVILANPLGVDLGTVQQVSGLSRVPAHHYFQDEER
jgi:hypothetical protein